MKYSCVLMMFVVTFLLVGPTPLPASDLFTYQGKLTNAVGQTLPGGQYRIGVRVWDVASGGTTPLWARKYDVAVVDGLFSLMIGAEGIVWNSPAPLTEHLKLAVSGTSRFLEIAVMSDANGAEKPAAQWQTLAPRQALGAVPYAFNGVPPGTVVPFAGAVIPDGWVRCDGLPYPASDARYAALAAVLQGAYGNDGPGTFRVPDLRGRTAIGTGKGENVSERALAEIIGNETTSLSVANLPDHVHGLDLQTQNDGAHAHRIDNGPGADTGGGDGAIEVGSSSRHRNWPAWNTSVSGAHSHKILGDTLADKRNEDLMQSEPFSVMQPSLVLNYIIKL